MNNKELAKKFDLKTDVDGRLLLGRNDQGIDARVSGRIHQEEVSYWFTEDTNEVEAELSQMHNTRRSGAVPGAPARVESVCTEGGAVMLSHPDLDTLKSRMDAYIDTMDNNQRLRRAHILAHTDAEANLRLINNNGYHRFERVMPEAESASLFHVVRENRGGKMETVKTWCLFVWVPVNTVTGKVDMNAIQPYDDKLRKLEDDWEWRRFQLEEATCDMSADDGGAPYAKTLAALQRCRDILQGTQTDWLLPLDATLAMDQSENSLRESQSYLRQAILSQGCE